MLSQVLRNLLKSYHLCWNTDRVEMCVPVAKELHMTSPGTHPGLSGTNLHALNSEAWWIQYSWMRIFSVSTPPFIYMTCPPFLIRSLSPIYKHDINLFRLCAWLDSPNWIGALQVIGPTAPKTASTFAIIATSTTICILTTSYPSSTQP